MCVVPRSGHGWVSSPPRQPTWTQEEPTSTCQAHEGRGWDVLETRFAFPFPAPPPPPDSTCLFWEHP